MITSHSKQKLVIVFTIIMLLQNWLYAQVREYRIHDRGMLHETVYNTGEISRPYQYGPAGEVSDVPLMEWPSRSSTVVNGIPYSGQHNSLGAGILLSGNPEGLPGRENRIYVGCGGIGTTTPELPFGVWSFPISIEEIENFPILTDEDGLGYLNPDYDPNEAEEIIIAKWATSIGITVTRTTRAWSYPDFDDMVIFEYEFEYTGDTDGYEETIENNFTLHDVLIHFSQGLAPSMFGIQRSYGSWFYDSFSRGDAKNYYDQDYWLAFDMVTRTGTADETINNGAAHPEPDPDNFLLWSETGINGGGLLSPQAAGICFLYYGIEHLAIVDPENPDLNESQKIQYLQHDAVLGYYELDDQNRIKQPWNMRSQTANARSAKLFDRAMNIDERWLSIHSPDLYAMFPNFMNTAGYPAPEGYDWMGRAYQGHTQAYNGTTFNLGWGPYTLELGDKFSIVAAEVVGYGATEDKKYIGGQIARPFGTAQSLNKQIKDAEGNVLTEAYLDDYGYPDYVNSDVITVNQVAHKAHEAYLGTTIPLDAQGHGPQNGILWPESNPSPADNTTKWQIPIPAPAPVILVKNTSQATVEILWNSSAEDFSHERLLADIDTYRIYRSDMGMGPWSLMDSIDVGDVDSQGHYYYEDVDEVFKLGESRYYAVTSVDQNGGESGKSNITYHTKNLGSIDQLTKVYAVPNPFHGSSGFTGSGGEEDAIGFYGLPRRCTIKIFSYAGQLVETLEHDADLYSTAWFQISRNDQDIASGIYVYVITTPDGDKATGKLIVVK